MLIINQKGEIKCSSISEYDKKVIQLVEKWQSQQEYFEIFTSGSTGQPKKIKLERNLIIESIKLTQKAFTLEPDDTLFCCLNAEYIAGMMMIFRALYLKTEILIIEPSSYPFENESIRNFLTNKSIFYAFVPLQMQTLLESENDLHLLNAAKAIIVGGAAVNQAITQKLQQISSPVYATYGMTETITHIAIQKLNGENQNGYFEALENVKLAVDENNCLKINAPTTKNEWIVTNDVVEIADSNKFKLIGRKDNIINSGGVKIQLEKVEAIIEEILVKEQLSLKRFFCWGVADEKLGQKLVIFAERNKTVLESDILQKSLLFKQMQASSLLSKFEKPKDLIWLDKFKETSTAKIDKIKTVNEYIQHKIPNR